MQSIMASIMGAAVTDVRLSETKSGVPMAKFRIVSQPRRFDHHEQTYRDAEPSFITVVCWRTLAMHVFNSIRKGDAVMAHGKLRVREYEHEGVLRTTVELDAKALGHDLSYGISSFRRHGRREIPLLSTVPVTVAA